MPDLTLVKVDAHAGRSGTWGGRNFRLGVHRQPNVSQEDVDKVVPYFERFFGAKPERVARAEHPGLFGEGGPYSGDHPVLGPSDVRRDGEQPPEGPADDVGGDAAPAPGPERQPADAGRRHERAEADGRSPGDPRHGEPELLTLPVDTEDDGSIEAEPQAAEDAAVAQDAADQPPEEAIDLAEAVGRLDPEDDGHWTPQGLPALKAVGELLGGRQVSRREVDQIAPDYSRAKAGQAKA